jgi:hypothetical protein
MDENIKLPETDLYLRSASSEESIVGWNNYYRRRIRKILPDTITTGLTPDVELFDDWPEVAGEENE